MTIEVAELRDVRNVYGRRDLGYDVGVIKTEGNSNELSVGLSGAMVSDIAGGENVVADVIIPKYSIVEKAYLYEAHLERAQLDGANLKRAYIEGANLEGANLNRANLKESNLEEANLTKTGLILEQLAEVDKLYGAVMPDGTKYEQWLANGKPDCNFT